MIGRFFRGVLATFGSLLIIIPLILLATAPLTLWAVQDDSEWRPTVVDKTVPHPNYREHAGLYWMLNHTRVPTPDGSELWRDAENYVGWYPEEEGPDGRALHTPLTRDHLVASNMLYIADSYGVYRDDFRYGSDEETHLDYSAKIWGGFDLTEVQIIEDFVGAGGALIAEFNTFASPTEGSARARLETLLGVRWTEWSGRFFIDLSDQEEVPTWAYRHWLRHHGRIWDFEGPGFIFAHEDTRIFVLQTGPDVTDRGLRIVDIKEDDPLMDGVRSGAPFHYWFDVNEVQAGAEALATYRIDATSRGAATMAAWGVPLEFPAMVRASDSPMILYFCGDFSDNELDRGPSFVLGWPEFRGLGRFAERRRDQNAFFWWVYVPTLENVFRDTSPRAGRPMALLAGRGR